MKYILQRGNIFWFRMRCPKRYRQVCGKDYICRSLETDSKAQAVTSAVLMRHQVMTELEAESLGRTSPADVANSSNLISLAKTHNVEPMTSSILARNVDEIVRRLALLQANDKSVESPAFAAVMGGYNYPDTLVSEVAQNMAELCPDKVSNKNRRQVNAWHSNYKRAAKTFSTLISDKPIKDITSDDAGKYMLFWDTRVRDQECTILHADKHIGYMRAMVDAYYRNQECVEYLNPFKGVKTNSRPNWEKNAGAKRKAEFSPNWIKQVIINGSALSGMNSELRDILIIAAETGCRHAEIFDAPASAFQLNCKIPHLVIQAEITGEDRREIKNRASCRLVPLVGAALEAAKRHPEGFARYRGNGRFSKSAIDYFTQNNLFPSSDHKLSSLRHSYESRMIHAGISNEMRGFMMGHSLKRIRGREVYGDEAALELKALYAEMVAFETQNWLPRSHAELQKEIDMFLTAQGFRVNN